MVYAYYPLLTLPYTCIGTTRAQPYLDGGIHPDPAAGTSATELDNAPGKKRGSALRYGAGPPKP